MSLSYLLPLLTTHSLTYSLTHSLLSLPCHDDGDDGGCCSLQEDGDTALMYASLNGHTDIVRLLLNHADINVNHADVSINRLSSSVCLSHVVVGGREW